jgi:hypothetical protein
LSSLTLAASLAGLALATPASAQRRPRPAPARAPAAEAPAAVPAAPVEPSPPVVDEEVPRSHAAEPDAAPTASTAYTSDEAARSLGPVNDRESELREHLLRSEQSQISVGWRAWAFWVPRFLVSPFVHIEPGWEGSLQPATGPEFVYRSGRFDIVLAGMFVGHSAPAGFFRGENEPFNATERIRANLWGLYLTSHFLWSIPVHKTFEIQIGGGIGVGYVGGDLYRSQAYQDNGSNEWRDCEHQGAAPECMNDNGHYTNGPNDPKTGLPQDPSRAYREPNWLGNGYTPLIMPWVSIPHVGLHFRPHRNFDLRVEGGYAIYGFYGGGSLHWVF